MTAKESLDILNKKYGIGDSQKVKEPQATQSAAFGTSVKLANTNNDSGLEALNKKFMSQSAPVTQESIPQIKFVMPEYKDPFSRTTEAVTEDKKKTYAEVIKQSSETMKKDYSAQQKKAASRRAGEVNSYVPKNREEKAAEKEAQIKKSQEQINAASAKQQAEYQLKQAGIDAKTPDYTTDPQASALIEEGKKSVKSGLKAWKLGNLAEGGPTNGEYDEIYRGLNETEKNELYYLIAKSGQDAAIRYLQRLKPAVVEERAKDVTEKAEAYAKEHPFLGAGKSILESAVSSPATMVSAAVDTMASAAQGKPLEKEEFYTIPTREALALRTGTGEAAADTMESMAPAVTSGLNALGIKKDENEVRSTLRNIGSFGSGLLIDSANSILMSLIPGGAALLGTSAAASSFVDSLDRGADFEDALLSGAVQGIFEGFFEEHFTLSNLRAFQAGDSKTIGRFLWDVFKSQISNAGEEINTEAADKLADLLITGDYSELKTNVAEYMNSGYSQEEAWKRALADAGTDVLMAGLGGFLSAGVSSVFSGGIGKAKNAIGNKIESTMDAKGVRAQAENEVNEFRNKQEADGKSVEMYGTTDQARQVQFREAELIANRFGKKMNTGDIVGSGSYSNDTITININTADPVMDVLIHELTHGLEQSSMYGQFSSYVMDYIRNDLGIDIEDMKKNIIKDYAEIGENLDDAGAQAELIAKFAAEMLFEDQRAIDRMYNTNPTLFERVYYAIQDMRTKVKGTSQEKKLAKAESLYKNALKEGKKSVETQTMSTEARVKEIQRRQEELRSQIDQEMRPVQEQMYRGEITPEQYNEEYDNRVGDLDQEILDLNDELRTLTGSETVKPLAAPGSPRYMYAGENSRTADLRKLAEAKQMEAENVANETIRQQTGWFKGMDGKWRYEIDDSGMKYFRGQDADLAENEEYRRFIELENKAIYGTASEAELAELNGPLKKWSGERTRKNAEIRNREVRLSDIIQHRELFEAYPELKNAVVNFSEAIGTAKGQYDPNLNVISINKSLRNAPESTLLHEIQHAVQNIEEFSGGAGFGKNSTEEDYRRYRNTAGEIEARDTASRKDMDKGARMLAAPMLNENAENNRNYNVSSELGRIIGKDGTDYGNGVFLNSTYLDGLSDEDRKEMVRMRISELAGQEFYAYDKNNNPIIISIANTNERFKNEKGKRVPVNKDLSSKRNNSVIRQEAVVLSDELINASRDGAPAPARHKHDWLDDNGRNKWNYRYTYLQERNGEVWKAVLNIANATDGRKILYDISSIKKMGTSGISAKPQSVETSGISAKLYGDNIANMGTDVKPLASPGDEQKSYGRSFGELSGMNNEGENLSEKQKEFFADSKIRDEEGNLIKVWHGTDAEFTVFDRTKGRSNMDIQGMFFSPWEIDAGGYGGTVNSYYLNIKNPASEGQGYQALRMFQGQNNAGVKARDYLISKGYDGVNNGNEEYIAFYPEQIKLTSNENPSGSEDVRYSYGRSFGELAAADSEYMDAVERGDMETAQHLVNEAAERSGYNTDSEYQGTSAFNGSAPSDEGYYSSKEEKLKAWENGDYEGSASLEDFRDGIDINNLEYIAFDNRSYRSADEMRKEAIRNIRETLNNGAKEITMYRSVPAGIAENSFRNGDWITPSREYAIENARVHGDYPGWENGYRIIEQKVPTSAVWWDGNDIAEWGYDDGRESAYKNTGNNRKLLDPVTYDDEGKVIPLSERFNEENGDIRYSAGRSFNDLMAAARPLAAPGITQTGAETTETSQVDNLPTKAREYLNRQENVLLRNVADALGASKYADRRYMKDVVRQISEEYLETGKISEESIDRLFGEAYEQARVVDEEWVKQNKGLDDYLRKVKLKVNDSLLSNFADSNVWMKDAKKFVKMGDDGSKVDVIYQELNEMYPEMFSEDIINEADQLQRIVDVAKDLQTTERNLDSINGADSDIYREMQYRDFEAAVYDAAAEFRNVRRYADDRASKENKKILTDEEVLEAYNRLHGLRKDAEKAVNRNLLTEKDNHVVDRLLRGEITMEEAEAMKDINIRGVKKVFEAKSKYEEAARVVKEAKRQRKEALKEKAAGFLEDADSWKDKRAGILYMRETAERNVRDIVKNKADAEGIIDNYFTPVHSAEAESTRYKNRHRETIKNLDLSRKIADGNKVSESYAVQLIGEAEANIAALEDNKYAKKRDGKTAAEWRAAISEFWAENPNLDRAKIENAIEVFREEYNGMIEDVNKVLVRNGYEPIPYRRGYFPHFEIGKTEGLFAQVKNLLGIDTEVTALPTEINGLTGSFKPGKAWFGNALERMGINTDYDAVMGFDKYVQGVSDVIYQTDNIQNLRALANEIRYRTSDAGIKERINMINENENLTEEQKQDQIAELYDKGKFSLSNFVVWLDEYTNLLANKKSKLDRGIESMFGRDAYNVLKGFEGRVAANMVSFNPGSWLTNFVPLTQAWTTVSTKDMIAGMWDTLKGYHRSDGFVDRSDYLTARFGSENLIKSWDKDPNVKGIKAAGRKYDQFIDWASGGMDVVDNFTSEAIVRARYYQNVNRGMSEAAAMEEANSFAAGLQAARTKGAMPTIFESRNPIVKLFTQFQLEVNNEFSWLFKDVRPELKKEGLAKLAAGLFKFLIGSYIYNEVYEYFVGRRCALDPLGIVNDTVGNATGYQIPNLIELATGNGSFETQKQGTYGTISELATNVAEELPFVGGLLGGGRLPISSAIPDVAKLAQAATDDEWDAKKRIDTAKKELVKPIAYLAAPGGGSQIKKIAEGHTAVREGGSYSVDKDGNDILQYPVFKDSAADKAKAMIKTTLFGKSSLKEAREWVDSGFKSESAKNTQFYKDLKEDGMTDREAYSYMKEFTGIRKTDDESANALKRDFLKESSENGEVKADSYRTFASDKKKDLLDSLSGEDQGKATEAMIALDEASKKVEKYRVVKSSGLSQNGKKKLIDSFDDNAAEKIKKVGLDDYIDLVINTDGKKQEDIIKYIKQKTSDVEKQKKLFEAAGYDLDSTKDGEVVKDGNFNKKFGIEEESEVKKLAAPKLETKLKTPELKVKKLAAP